MKSESNKKKTHSLVSFGKTSHAKCHRQIKFVQLFCFVGIVIILFLIFQNTPKQLRNKKTRFYGKYEQHTLRFCDHKQNAFLDSDGEATFSTVHLFLFYSYLVLSLTCYLNSNQV